jgi:hypothetical protein
MPCAYSQSNDDFVLSLQVSGERYNAAMKKLAHEGAL